MGSITSGATPAVDGTTTGRMPRYHQQLAPWAFSRRPVTPEEEADWREKQRLASVEYASADIAAARASTAYEAVAESPTDIAVRDLESGRVRRARTGSQRSALFDPNAPASSVLGSV